MKLQDLGIQGDDLARIDDCQKKRVIQLDKLSTIQLHFSPTFFYSSTRGLYINPWDSFAEAITVSSLMMPSPSKKYIKSFFNLHL